jgi:hypothetical protein
LQELNQQVRDIRNEVNPRLAQVAATVALCLSCHSEKRENDACLDARRRTHEAMSTRDVPAASSALATARTECTQASEYDIDRLQRAIEREQRHQSEITQLAQQANAKTNPLTEFMSWVRSHRESGARTPGQTSCEPRQSPRFGLCVTRFQREDASAFELHYWQAAPNDAYRFAWEFAGALSCDDAGPHRPLRKWNNDGVEHELCELSQHGLIGLRALVVHQPGASRIEIYAPGYLSKDPEFAQRL